jgi:signal peptidase
VVIVLAAAAVAVLVVIPRATHGAALTVLTGSMTPGIPVGSVVVDRPVDPRTLEVGDIATYQKSPGVDEYITHRIVAIHPETTPITFTFKGDANRGADITPVPATAIRGQVWFHVPYIGAIRDGLQSHGTRGLVLAVVLVGLGGYSVFQVVGGVRQQRRGSSDDASADASAAAELTDGETQTLAVPLGSDALAGVHPTDVARVLGGTVTERDGVLQLTFVGSPERLRVIEQLLRPHAATADVVLLPEPVTT